MKLKAIFTKRQNTLGEIEQALAECTAREREITQRLALISQRWQGGPDGAERRRVQLEGSGEDLARLDDEVRALALELREALPARVAELYRRRDGALVATAAATLPGVIKALTKAAEARRVAAAALAALDAELNLLTSDALVKRRRLKQAGRPAPAVDSEVVEAIAAARGLVEPEKSLHYSVAAQALFRELSDRDSPGKRSADERAASMSKSEAGRRQARQTGSSFWDPPSAA